MTKRLSLLVFLASFALSTAATVALGGGKPGTRLSEFASPTVSSGPESKVSAGLRYMVAAFEAVRSDGMNAASASALYDGSLYFRLMPGATDPEAPVLIKINNPGALAALEHSGVRIDTKVDDILVGRVPITRVHDVAGISAVNSMSISGESMPMLSMSRVEAKVDQVHVGAGGLGQAYKGAGVLVGVLDSGIDFAHPDFNIAPGNARIQGILDYGNAGTNGPPTEFTKAQIDGGQCTEVDGEGGHGHGTHVTGIAAGGGRRNAAYIGMAPESDILFVKGIRDPQSQGGFNDNDVIQGVQWMFGKATALNRPCVVNLSLGGQFGPHDGTSLYEQALSSMVKPGRIIVAAAGNEGSAFVHSSFEASGTSYNDAPEVLWEMSQGSTLSAVDMWYPPTGTMSVGIGVYTVSGGQLQYIANTAPVAPGNFIENVQLMQGSTVLGTVSVDARTTADPNNGARNAFFVVQGPNISQYIWTVYAFGSGTLDAWMLTGGRFSPPIQGLPLLYKFGDNDKSVGSPSTAKRVICVGAYVSRNSWTDINNAPQTQQSLCGAPAPQIGELACFSSHGPSRDGRTKPDFVAPGEVIISALSSGYTASASGTLLGGGLQTQSGTSQASPHVTGIVALMLQKNKFLTYENATSLLTSTANPVVTGNLWGAGRVRALEAMLATPPGVDCVMLAKQTGFDCDGNRVLQYQLVDAYPNPFNPATTIGFRIGEQQQVDLAIYDILGRRIRTITNDILPEGMHNVVWDGADDNGRQVSSGVYYTRLVTPRFAATNKLLMLK